MTVLLRSSCPGLSAKGQSGKNVSSMFFLGFYHIWGLVSNSR